MSNTTLRIAVALALSAIFGAPAQAEPRTFTGTVRIEFPGGPAPIQWDVPVAGIGRYQDGAATNTEEGFVISNTVTVNIGTSTSVMGTLPNPFFGGGNFATGQIQTLKLGQGMVRLATSANPLGLRVSMASLDLQGITGSGATMTFNHPLLRVGTSNATFHPGATYLTTSSAYSASGFDSTWSETLNTMTFNGGNLNVVSPIVLSTQLPGDGDLSGTAKLELTFAPEPTTGLMLLAGAGVLVALGRQRKA